MGSRRFLILALLTSFCAGCVSQVVPEQAFYRAPAFSGPNYRTARVTKVDIKSLPQTIGLEHADRIKRFARLASIYGIAPPEITEMQLPAGSIPGVNYGVPVVRVLFDARVFFDFDSDTVHPDAERVLSVFAENMRRDVPDAQVLILGHTDAVGSDSYNLDLSKRRALSVMQSLVHRGVRATQLSTVAIGKYQPIAPNSTETGRMRNRRVEFMISASQEANLALVHQRRIYEADLAIAKNVLPPPIAVQIVQVYRATVVIQQANQADAMPRSFTEDPAPALPDRPSQPASVQQTPVLTPVSTEAVTLQPQKEITLQKPEADTYILNKPSDVQLRPLDEEFKPFEASSGS